MSTEKKTVFITGASSGIGYHLAIEFARRGYKVFAGARRIGMMEPLKQYGITPIELDISSTQSILAAREIITKETNGKLDILYNNAGAAHPGSIFDLEKEQIETVFKVNVYGPLEIIKAFQKELLESQGTVAFTSSIVQFAPAPFGVLYAASKSAFSYIPKVLSLETGKLGIKVVDIVTGAVESEIWEGSVGITPSNSVFYLEGDEIIKTFGDKRTPTTVYSKQAVDGIERAVRKANPYTQFYAGNSTTVAWIFGTFVPFWLYTKIIYVALKLNEPLQKIANKLRKKD